MEILKETNDMIFVMKPRGVASQSARGQTADMVSLLSEETGHDIYCVHRLDTTTGGVMVYAKNKKAAAYLSEAFKDNLVKKEYLAVVSGTTPETGEMTDFLWHDKAKNKSFTIKTKRAGSKEAKLTYERLAVLDSMSLVRIELQTGRTHQIRVQFASRGYPLCGDGKYGGKTGMPLALWCESLSVPDKTRDKLITVNCPPPNDEKIWSSFSM